jgi:Electron transfer DM13
MRTWWRPRWWELVPEAAVAVGLTVFFVLETSAATSAFKSGKAITLMAVTAVGWVVGRVLLARFVPWSVLRTAVFALAGAAILAVVVFPAYHNVTVVETFPVARAAAPAATTATAPPAAATTAPPPAEPVRFKVGMFRGVDHRASGTVALYRRPDGSHVVGLEMFDIQPGPDYDVYVVPGEERQSKSGGIRLDDLKGNRGTQYYDVPASADLSAGAWTVLVWCQTFAVPVATATPV